MLELSTITGSLGVVRTLDFVRYTSGWVFGRGSTAPRSFGSLGFRSESDVELRRHLSECVSRYCSRYRTRAYPEYHENANVCVILSPSE